MKTILSFALALLSSASLTSLAPAAPPVQEPVTIALGPKAYRDGDVIEIVEVSSTSKNLEQGDSITVRGRVRLDSRNAASLCLFVTQTESSSSGAVDPEQCKNVASGLTTFELKTIIKHKGALHLTLYDQKSGKPFGGVYFGTPQQMSRISDWNVQYYLAD
jgi:hypothetical protein